MDDTNLSGNISFDQTSSGGQPPEAPAPDSAADQYAYAQSPDTGEAAEQPFVVPATSTQTSNPFVPQVTPDASGQPDQGYAVSSGRRGGNKLFLIFVILLLVAGGAFLASKLLAPKDTELPPVTTTGGGASKKITLTYWGLWEDNAILESVLKQYESTHPNVGILYSKQNPKEYRERLQAFINKGEGPDVFRFHNTWIPMLRNELSPAPSTIMSAADFAASFYPVANADLVGGQYVYGIPLMIDGLGLYYNEDLFQAAGVSPPETWNDVLELVPKLTVKQADNTIVTSAIALGTTGNVEHFSDIIATMLMQNGAQPVNPTGQQAEEALSFYKKFSTTSDPMYTWNDSMDNSVFAFASGKVAMILAPSWRTFDILQINPAAKFKIVPIPQLPGNTVTWASYWVEGVSAKSKHAAEAWEFVNYMTSRDVAVKLYTEQSKVRLFGEPYARMDLGASISEDPHAGAYIKQAMTAKSFPLASRTFDNGINDKLIKYIEDAINSLAQGTSPQAALDTVKSGFDQVLGGYGLKTNAASTPSL